MTSRQGPRLPEARSLDRRSRTDQRTRGGGWYFLVTVLSAGFLAAVPFWHAASRLGRPERPTPALLYTAADIYLVILMILTPPQNPDGSSGNETISTLGGFSVLAIIIVACIQLSSFAGRSTAGPTRRRRWATVAGPRDPRALEARARREEARRLVAQDPALAREPASAGRTSDAGTTTAASSTSTPHRVRGDRGLSARSTVRVRRASWPVARPVVAILQRRRAAHRRASAAVRAGPGAGTGYLPLARGCRTLLSPSSRSSLQKPPSANGPRPAT